MLSPDMRRILISAVLGLAILPGCAVSPPVPVVEQAAPEVIYYSSVQHWLKLQDEVAAMSVGDTTEELADLDKPDNAGDLFYHGLLNQQLQTNDAWVQARDAFRTLREDDELTVEQQQLAGILEVYNQNRINWYQRQSDLLIDNSGLQQQLLEAEQDKLLLEQKIQALTQLEADISTRKEE
jgi:hypothetical protein